MKGRFFILLVIFCFAVSGNLFSEEQEKTVDTPKFFIGTGIYWGDIYTKSWSRESSSLLYVPSDIEIFLGAEINKYISLSLSASGATTSSVTIIDYDHYVPDAKTGPLNFFSFEVNFRPVYGLFFALAPQLGYMNGESDGREKKYTVLGYVFGGGYRFEITEQWILRLSLKYSRFYTHIHYNDEWDKWFENYYLIFGPSLFYRF